MTHFGKIRRRRRVPARMSAALLLAGLASTMLNGCSINRGFQVADMFESFARGLDGVASVEVKGRNILPYAGEATGSVTAATDVSGARESKLLHALGKYLSTHHELKSVSLTTSTAQLEVYPTRDENSQELKLARSLRALPHVERLWMTDGIPMSIQTDEGLQLGGGEAVAFEVGAKGEVIPLALKAAGMLRGTRFTDGDVIVHSADTALTLRVAANEGAQPSPALALYEGISPLLQHVSVSTKQGLTISYPARRSNAVRPTELGAILYRNPLSQAMPVEIIEQDIHWHVDGDPRFAQATLAALDPLIAPERDMAPSFVAVSTAMRDGVRVSVSEVLTAAETIPEAQKLSSITVFGDVISLICQPSELPRLADFARRAEVLQWTFPVLYDPNRRRITMGIPGDTAAIAHPYVDLLRTLRPDTL